MTLCHYVKNNLWSSNSSSVQLEKAGHKLKETLLQNFKSHACPLNIDKGFTTLPYKVT